MAKRRGPDEQDQLAKWIENERDQLAELFETGTVGKMNSNEKDCMDELNKQDQLAK